MLIELDNKLRSLAGHETVRGAVLLDAVRYVDDIRLVFSVDQKADISSLEEDLYEWLNRTLNQFAPGLELSREKTVAAVFRGEERPIVNQSNRMKRIQSDVSGGFDATGGREILGAILGLVGAQARLGSKSSGSPALEFLPVPNAKDDTVDRFAAARFRSTYRSLRPLLFGDDVPSVELPKNDRFGSQMSREELDEEAKAFAYELIAKWIENPSNVRLLRIGLDIWPDAELLRRVLSILEPAVEIGRPENAANLVAKYCLAELFRAGATETGFTDDPAKLSPQVDRVAYRELLAGRAVIIAENAGNKLPWYLVQQAYLLLATSENVAALSKLDVPNDHYVRFLKFLSGDDTDLSDHEYAVYSVLARRSFKTKETALKLVSEKLNAARLNRIARIDPDFGGEIVELNMDLQEQLYGGVKGSLGFKKSDANKGEFQLASFVLEIKTKELLRNELPLLDFALKFLHTLSEHEVFDHITPSDVYFTFSSAESQRFTVDSVRISRVGKSSTSLYSPPNWCPTEEQWRFQLGYILRFILTAKRDFTKPVRASYWKDTMPIYRPLISHWHQRFYGLFNGHSAFGDDWLPISDWVEDFLFCLLRWPGCPGRESDESIIDSLQSAIEKLRRRINFLKGFLGTSVDCLPFKMPRAYSESGNQPIRACIIQTIIPSDKDFDEAFKKGDLTLSEPGIRTRHRRHLSAALAAIVKSLELRETHKNKDGRLDLLVFPELAIHRDDIESHIIPFVRKYRTTVLAGLVYERIRPAEPLVNSALWILPKQDAAGGVQVQVRRQGKSNLAPLEAKLNNPHVLIKGFRPIQWLIGYQWTTDPGQEPLWLTALICYDATDIKLAADLRDHSDIYLVPALNRDVDTFDRMAQALHYHMFQMVIVANNGLYGGSNAYAPYRKAFERKVFHMHGQPQSSIAFMEIDDIAEFKKRRKLGKGLNAKFKSPPAAGSLASKDWDPD